LRTLGNALFSAYAAIKVGNRITNGMAQPVITWMRIHGGLALLAGGMAIYLILLVLDLSVGWRLAYPYNLAWIGVVALPGAGVALMYLQTCDGRDDDGEHGGYEKGEMR
tara:strand:- start:25710 stop:26036 length:327 start_codon:yes stop_codon:yes gene_type:complete